MDTRFKLKKLICDENLEMNTQTALIREKERLKRLKQKREVVILIWSFFLLIIIMKFVFFKFLLIIFLDAGEGGYKWSIAG